MGKPNDPSTAGGEKRKDNRKTFSVSKGFSDIHDILDALPENEASRFICEAIRFYHQYKSNPNWMGEQLQSMIAMTTQLQQAMVGLGGVGIPVPTAFPNAQQMTPMPVSPSNPMGYGAAPSQMFMQPSQPPVEAQPPSDPSANNEGLKTPSSAVETAKEDAGSSQEETMAVEPENRYRSNPSSTPTPSEKPASDASQPTRTRRRGGMASSLIGTSMGVKPE